MSKKCSLRAKLLTKNSLDLLDLNNRGFGLRHQSYRQCTTADSARDKYGYAVHFVHAFDDALSGKSIVPQKDELKMERHLHLTAVEMAADGARGLVLEMYQRIGIVHHTDHGKTFGRLGKLIPLTVLSA